MLIIAIKAVNTKTRGIFDLYFETSRHFRAAFDGFKACDSA
jgi:hypothetical protein